MATKEKEADGTALMINRFASLIKENAQKNVGKAETILGMVRKCRTTTPNLVGEDRIAKYLKARNETLAALNASYLTARLTTRYPLVDKTLFKMQRHLTITKEGVIVSDRTKSKNKRAEAGTNRCSVPLFAEVPFGGSRKAELGKYSFREFDHSHSYTNTRTTSVSIHATLPDPPNSVADASKKAAGFYYGIVADMYGDDLLADHTPEVPESPTFSVIWIPAPAALGIKTHTTVVPVKVETTVVHIPRAYDPALLMSVGKNQYLVKLYDIEDEEPIENFLREYTTGPFPKK